METNNSNFKEIKGKKIAVLIIENKNAINNIIFSHGNSSNLSTVYPFILDLSTQFNVNFLLRNLKLIIFYSIK
jgi:hypothetical protein